MTTTPDSDGAAYASVSERAAPEWHAGFRAGMAAALSTHTAQPLTDGAHSDALQCCWRSWRVVGPRALAVDLPPTWLNCAANLRA